LRILQEDLKKSEEMYHASLSNETMKEYTDLWMIVSILLVFFVD